MPVGIQRLNQRHHHPNDRITFIKPLSGPTAATATVFLERIAAQCLPIMKNYSLSVTTLEEHEPNREFVGRNFNSGEIIQLVLHPLRRKQDDAYNGIYDDESTQQDRWLPFKYVQMVMMHELAHCIQMNHSRAFWAVRNTYAGEMRGLWSTGYTGEGIWGRGRSLETGAFDNAAMPDASDLPENLCGGTYRRRGRKRGRGGNGQDNKEKLSYAERKQRRIEKKFGKEGQDLGSDEDVRRYLEKGKTNDAAPRVAKSKRGRDLRAMAVELRMKREKAEKEAEEELRREDEEETADEDEDDFDEDADGDEDNMVKVCGEEDGAVEDAKNEMMELSQITASPQQKGKLKGNPAKRPSTDVPEEDLSTTEDEAEDERLDEAVKVDTAPVEFTRHQSLGRPQQSSIQTQERDESAGLHIDQLQSNGALDHPQIGTDGSVNVPASTESSLPNVGPATSSGLPTLSMDDVTTQNGIEDPIDHDSTFPGQPSNNRIACDSQTLMSSLPDNTRSITNPAQTPTLRLRPPSTDSTGKEQVCPICSLTNSPSSLTCQACSHVLDIQKLSRCWTCETETCKSLGYTNSEDVGRCGLCGSTRVSV